MKKIKLFLILLALSLSLIACNSNKDKADSKKEVETKESIDNIEEKAEEKNEKDFNEGPQSNTEDNTATEEIQTEDNPDYTYLNSSTYETKEPMVIKDINKRIPDDKEVFDYLAEFADKVRSGDPSFLDFLVWPEEYKEKEELARIKVASILNDKDAKDLWTQIFKDFRIIQSVEGTPFNISGQKEETGKSIMSVFTINQLQEQLISSFTQEELAEFNKKHPYRDYNISDKDQLLPIYKDLLKKNLDYSKITIDKRPIKLGDLNNTGHASIDGEQFMANNVFYFPVAIDEQNKKAYWNFYSIDKISEFIPYKLNDKDDKELIAYKNLFTQGKLVELYDLILKNSEEKGFSFRDNSELRYSLGVAEEHYQKLGIKPRMIVTTNADVYGDQKEEDMRVIIHYSGLEAMSYTPKSVKEIVQFLPYHYSFNSEYIQEKFARKKEDKRLVEVSSAESIFLEILEDLEIKQDRPIELITEIKTR